MHLILVFFKPPPPNTAALGTSEKMPVLEKRRKKRVILYYQQTNYLDLKIGGRGRWTAGGVVLGWDCLSCYDSVNGEDSLLSNLVIYFSRVS